MNFVSVFDQLRNVAMLVPGCPTPTLQAAYVKVMRDWCAQTQWLRTTVLGPTVASQQIYSLGNDPLLEIIAVVGVQGEQSINQGIQFWKVVPGDSGSWDPNMPTGMPTRYTYIPEGQIAFNPTPDKAYNMTMAVAVQPASNARTIPAEPLKKYSTEFEAGALEYLLSMKQMPWHDPAQAAKFGRVYQSGVSNGKAEVQRNFNTGSQRVLPRPFFR